MAPLVFCGNFPLAIYNPRPMKPINLILSIFLMISVALVAAHTVQERDAQAFARAPEKEASFEGSPEWQKLDLRMREAWREAQEKGRRKKQLECLIKTKKRVSKDERSLLEVAGFAPRSVIGTIITGSVQVRHVPQVAGLDFVEAMELAVPMSIK
jgi:hypothetical protein